MNLNQKRPGSEQSSTPSQRLLGVLGRFTRTPLVVHNLVRLIGATAVGQAITIVAAPLLTRLYSPEEFGVSALFTSVVTTVGTVATLRYESAIPLPKDDEESRTIVALCVSLSIVVATGIGFFLWLINANVLRVTFLESVKSYWLLVALGVVGTGIYQALSQWTIRVKAFPVLARTRVQQGVAAVVTQIFLGVVGLRPLGLLLGQVVSRSAGIRVLGKQLWRQEVGLVGLFQVTRMRNLAKRYVRFPLLSMPSAFLNSLTLSLPSFMLASYYDSVTVGLYSLTVRVAGIPMTIVGSAVGNVYLGEAAELLRERPEKFRQFFYSTVKKMAVAGILGVGVPLLLARYIVPFVFGAQWADSGAFLQLLAPMYAMQFIAAPFGGTLAVLQRQDLFLLREVVRLFLVGSALWLGPSLGKNAVWTVGAFGLAGMLGYGVYLYVAKVAVERWYQEGKSDEVTSRA